MHFNEIIPYRIYYGSQLELAYAVDILLVLDDKSLGMKHRRYHIEAEQAIQITQFFRNRLNDARIQKQLLA